MEGTAQRRSQHLPAWQGSPPSGLQWSPPSWSTKSRSSSCLEAPRPWQPVPLHAWSWGELIFLHDPPPPLWRMLPSLLSHFLPTYEMLVKHWAGSGALPALWGEKQREVWKGSQRNFTEFRAIKNHPAVSKPTQAAASQRQMRWDTGTAWGEKQHHRTAPQHFRQSYSMELSASSNKCIFKAATPSVPGTASTRRTLQT